MRGIEAFHSFAGMDARAAPRRKPRVSSSNGNGIASASFVRIRRSGSGEGAVALIQPRSGLRFASALVDSSHRAAATEDAPRFTGRSVDGEHRLALDGDLSEMCGGLVEPHAHRHLQLAP